MVPTLEIKKKLYDYATIRTQESWLVTLIKRLLEKDGNIEETDINIVGKMLLDGDISPETPTMPTDASVPQVELKKLTHLCGVNALMPSQTITFCEEGVTFIYGLNGSGKTSYYKSLQYLAGKIPMLNTNIYNLGSSGEQQLEITYSFGDTDITYRWRSGEPAVCDAIKNIAFFDSSYANKIIESVKANEIVLRPYNFPLMGRLNNVLNQLAEMALNNVELLAQIKKHLNALSPQSYFADYLINLRPLFESELRALNIQHQVIVGADCDSGGAPCLSLKMSSSSNVGEIMSEGELKGVSLALFLAQIQMLSPNIPVVFDDPVSSLDSYIMQRFVKRISEMRNQVIIFSHNIMMLEMCKSDSVFKLFNTTTSKDQRLNSTSIKRGLFIYTIEGIDLGKVGYVYPDRKGVEAQIFLNKANSQLLDPMSDVDAIQENLRRAVEHLIDEKVFRNYIPTRFRLPQSSLKWSDYRNVCNQGDATINALKTAYDELSNGGLHAGFGSTVAPMSRADCRRIYNTLSMISEAPNLRSL